MWGGMCWSLGEGRVCVDMGGLVEVVATEERTQCTWGPFGDAGL